MNITEDTARWLYSDPGCDYLNVRMALRKSRKILSVRHYIIRYTQENSGRKVCHHIISMLEHILFTSTIIGWSLWNNNTKTWLNNISHTANISLGRSLYLHHISSLEFRGCVYKNVTTFYELDNNCNNIWTCANCLFLMFLYRRTLNIISLYIGYQLMME